ncbi:phytanoyl-CoA dioxygenase family protein [Endozoicomonas lisbonensis]|uniref:Ectoine hydroxylase-related dioxygenase (Phytanoyl-CoA dioxygenase family) n=1 Tax=Endozoicomonas lisbonensis TaxID=3120522 RepID=A0ABV2SD65_9GAMM
MIISEDWKSEYKKNGYLIIKGGVDTRQGEFCSRLNRTLELQAKAIRVPVDDYLRAVCRWDSPNDIVQKFVRELKPKIQPLISSILDRSVEIVRASVIRKHYWAGKATHGHQDAGYWLKNASQAYDISSWIALEDVDESNGALKIIPASHLSGAEPQQDFLSKGFEDPADFWGDKSLTLSMSAGDILLFSPYLWHASHPCSKGRTRTAFVMRWAGIPPIYEAIDTIETEHDSATEFGMSTSGKLLSDSLMMLLQNKGYTATEKREDLICLVLKRNLTNILHDPVRANLALKKLLILTLAKQDHYGNDLGAGIWEEIRDSFVEPCKVLFGEKGDA